MIDIFDINIFKSDKNFETTVLSLPKIYWDEKYHCWVITSHQYIKQYLFDYKLFTVSKGYLLEHISNKEARSTNFGRPNYPDNIESRIDTSKHIKKYLNTIDNNLILKNINNNKNILLEQDILLNFLIDSHLHLIKLNEEEKFEIKTILNEYSQVFDTQIQANYYIYFINIINKIFKQRSINLSKLEKKFYVDLLFSGTSTILSALKEMILNIDKYEESNSNYINECLRHSSKSSFVIRTATSDTIIDNNIIKANDIVIFHLGFGNFDVHRFDKDTFEFRSNRKFDRISLSFGSGPNQCVGYRYSLRQLNDFLNFIKNKNIKINKIIELEKFNARMYYIDDILIDIDDKMI